MSQTKGGALFATAVAHHQAGRLTDAERIYREALAIDPTHAHCLHNLGILAVQTSRPALAVELIERAIARDGTNAAFHTHLGVGLRAVGRLADAVEAHRRAVGLKPDYAEAYNNLGNALLDLGRRTEARESYREAVNRKPDYVEALQNLASLLREEGGLEEAAQCYRRALALAPRSAELHNNLGNVLQTEHRLDEAIVCYRQAIALDATYASPHGNLASALRRKGAVPEAIALYEQAIALDPDYAEAHHNLGGLLRSQGQLARAATCYARAFALQPEYHEALAELVYVRRSLCDWSCFESDRARLLEWVHNPAARIPPFILLNMGASPADQLLWAQRWIAPLTAPADKRFAHVPRPPRDSRRLRVGYLSADFHRHATSYLMAELFERHDRHRFEISGYSLGPDDGSEIRRRVVAAFDRFTDLGALPHGEAARRVHAEEVDILIDLKGFTHGARTEILTYRPAPLQVNFLGYPGTMGSDLIDYALVDAFVVPPEQATVYAEKLVWLPDCYQPNDTQRLPAEATPTRADCGLPEAGFVFCCFNNSFKLTPSFFDIWMRLLGAVPGSVLWLLEDNEAMRGNLRREAEARGIAADRLVFAPRTELAEHLARHRLADLFLDTLPYNAHTTASDALWMGVPVVTCAGGDFAGRVAGSLLRAVGLPELVTGSLADYEELALDLARQPARLAALQHRLVENRRTAPLFDIAGYTRALEAAFDAMWDRWERGEQPQSFAVAEPNPARDSSPQADAARSLRSSSAAPPAASVFAEANRLQDLGRLADAALCYERALLLEPDSAEIRNNFGNALLKQGRLGEAVARYREAIALEPGYARPHGNLGAALFSLGELDAAAASFAEATRLDPAYVEAHYNLGLLRQGRGELEGAVAAYRQAIACTPVPADAHANLGTALADLGRTEEAILAFREATARNPADAVAWTNLGNALVDIGNTEEAVPAYEQALRRAPAGAGLEAAVWLALLHCLQGNLAGARAMLAAAQPITATTDRQKKVARIYWAYLSKLVPWYERAADGGPGPLPTLHAVGESHALAAHLLTVRYDETEMQCRAHWISGCKQWHLGNAQPNKYKRRFAQVLDGLPRGSTILLCFGEIDCRPDEGILAAWRKSPGVPLEQIVRDTVESYLDHVGTVAARAGHALIVCGVPAGNLPLRDMTADTAETFPRLLAVFNRLLGESAVRRGFSFLDVYALTDRGDGTADGAWHIDERHLRPDALQEAFRARCRRV